MPSTSASPVPASTPSQLPAYRTGAMLIGIGVGHFVMPKPFDTIVPAELPGSPRFYTLASGVAEIGVGAAMLLHCRPQRCTGSRCTWPSSRPTSTWSAGGT
ncbi:MAG: hypothetical protein H6522_05775 [Mycolicibacterium sp.]|nr:hypothetical protein [Mycolicibacterium sp.]